MNIKRRITALLLTVAVAFGSAGCSSKKIDTVNSVPPASSTSAETVLNAVLAMAPDITGLNKQIQNDKVVYVAKEGNAYGLETNSYAGQFKKEVTIEGTETGGVALVPKVAQKLLTDAIAQIPADQNKLKVLPPLDISNVDSSETISIKSAICTNVNAGMLVVEYNSNKIPLVSVQQGTNHFNISQGSIPLSFKEKDKDITIPKVEAIAPVISTNNYYIKYYFSQEFASAKSSADLNFGDNAGLEVGSPIVIAVISSISELKFVSVDTSKLLNVDGHTVFMVANSTSGT